MGSDQSARAGPAGVTDPPHAQRLPALHARIVNRRPHHRDAGPARRNFDTETHDGPTLASPQTVTAGAASRARRIVLDQARPDGPSARAESAAGFEHAAPVGFCARGEMTTAGTRAPARGQRVGPRTFIVDRERHRHEAATRRAGRAAREIDGSSMAMRSPGRSASRSRRSMPSSAPRRRCHVGTLRVRCELAGGKATTRPMRRLAVQPHVSPMRRAPGPATGGSRDRVAGRQIDRPRAAGAMVGRKDRACRVRPTRVPRRPCPDDFRECRSGDTPRQR